MMTAEQLEVHREALVGHCYRMLGSAAEADDAVQETLVRAWRALEGFDGRASLRTWLYRIATHVCLDALADRARRERPVAMGPAGTIHDDLVERPRTHWLEPIPDVHALPADGDPAERAALRQSIRLAFVAALQRLPPRQRAALLLAEVLGWPASEIASALETTVAAVNSALQRARATLAESAPPEGAVVGLTPAQATLLARYVDAFERYDVDALAALMREDATLSMPPYTLWLRGPAAIKAWFLGRGIGCRGSRLVPTAANGLPAFGQYRPGAPGEPHRPWSLVVLELSGDRIVAMNHFLDTATLFPRFGLPPELA
ncbi:sigma-70 family RNA polymerase sigma factor [Anaeromyxobacter oryzae]|uniref:DNA-directed RNA polymerase sigma-70 factor n=1 Tax=Anaeromyxobacter oryzae TaxID=2918170 RepID=A0ABN6MZJ9_9BACT|nr:sigma-70 family RNA polymerase sigma factor [Anaeromyxobacter oryzae]BDG05148.1 DNA-directed RNA polymerase sigma-70 factor [Anaeromyxobacter oryzae]